MSELVNTSKRQLVPRWHDSSVGLKALKWKPRNSIDIHQASEKLETDFDVWSKNKTLPAAMEIVEKLHNFDIDLPKYKSRLHDFLSSAKHQLTAESKLFLTDANSVPAESQLFKVLGIHARINALKIRTRNSQADPLAWHDLAYHYSILNEDVKAEKCLKIAMRLSGSNTYIARSYSRFLVHKMDPEKAVRMLTKNKSMDPRIVSAEISIRARFGIGQPNLKQARNLVERNESTPGIISELAASLATIDYQVGHDKRAKKFIKSSMLDMTENVEAHLRWLLQKSKVDISIELSKELVSPEATAIDLYERDMLTECRDALVDVYQFQPFSAGSLIDAAFLSVALGDYESVVSLSRDYDFAIGRNGMAQNNLAVALILQNELDEASRIVDYLEYTNFSTDSESTFLATKGLLSYRMGDSLNGSRLYDLARETLSGSAKLELEGLASSFQASEEIKVNRAAGIEMIKRAEKEASHSSLKKEIKSFTKLVREKHDVEDGEFKS